MLQLLYLTYFTCCISILGEVMNIEKMWKEVKENKSLFETKEADAIYGLRQSFDAVVEFMESSAAKGDEEKFLQGLLNYVRFRKNHPKLKLARSSTLWSLLSEKKKVEDEREGDVRYGLITFPNNDHSTGWKIAGISATQFVVMHPYLSAVEDVEYFKKECEEFAKEYDIGVEFDPADIGNFYYPKDTIQVLWSRKGSDWRNLSKGV